MQELEPKNTEVPIPIDDKRTIFNLLSTFENNNFKKKDVMPDNLVCSQISLQRLSHHL